MRSHGGGENRGRFLQLPACIILIGWNTAGKMLGGLMALLKRRCDETNPQQTWPKLCWSRNRFMGRDFYAFFQNNCENSEALHKGGTGGRYGDLV